MRPRLTEQSERKSYGRTRPLTFFKMAYYFYILQCIDRYKYYGHTNDLARRISEHSNGKVKATEKRRPVRLVYFEEMKSRKEAFKREMQFKNGRTKKATINKLINRFAKEKCQGFNSHANLRFR